MAKALELAALAGVEIETYLQTGEEFDFGTDKWDLIVLSYVSARSLIAQVVRSLAPGGRVVLEAFHKDATEGARPAFPKFVHHSSRSFCSLARRADAGILGNERNR